MTILKAPKITKKSKIGQMFNNPVILSKPFEKFKMNEDRKKYKLKRSEYMNKLDDLESGNTSYLVSGEIKNIIRRGIDQKKNDRYSSYKRKYSIAFTANSNLTESELRSIVGNKLREYYLTPRDGNSSNFIEGFSMNSFELPDNYSFNKNVRMFKLSHIESKMMKKYTPEIDVKVNCVVDYLYDAFNRSGIAINKNKDKIIKRLSEFCKIDEGISIEAFEEYMNKYHQSIRYTILSPNFDCVSQFNPKGYIANLHLTFYVNNSHLYPIQNTNVQKYIARHLTEYKNYNFHSYFESMETTKYQNYTYMEKYDPEKEEECKTYIMNKDLNINDFCINLVKETNAQPDFIDLNHKTGSIQSFKHPTKDIIYESYDDYHRRKSICKKLNDKFNNEFIVFNNQSIATISNTLINYLDQIPKSDYNEHTFDYLNKYEPKPIIDILKSCSFDYVKENIKQIDYYKQYSSIFYKDFQKDDFKIPIYDFFNTVEEYKKEDITYGEYFVKQKKIKGVKVFGCFIHYKVVEILLKEKYITKDDISHCITTKKYYEPTVFKEFVEITSELDVDDFKKINNILNGTLKDMFSKKTTSYFTTDINSLCYIYNDAISNNIDIKWQYNEATNYHFIQTIKKHKRLTNTSSFYRATLSSSILQTVRLIKKCSKYGKIVKVLTDAVYYEPNTDELLKCPDIIPNEIISNLGKYNYDFCDKELVKSRTKNIIFEEIPIIKRSTFISGAGGLGKTYSTIQNFKENDLDSNILFTSFTNEATLNIKNTINKVIGYIPKNWKLTTITRLFQSRDPLGKAIPGFKILNKFDKVVIDEIFMTPSNKLKNFEQSNIEKIYIGDDNQNHQVFKNRQETNYLNYFKKYSNIIEKSYEGPNKSRYDEETYELLEDFKKSGNISKIIKKVSNIEKDKYYRVNIAYTNEKVCEINKKCCDYFHKDGEIFEFCRQEEEYVDDNGEKIEAKKNTSKKKYKIGVGCPVRCLTNNKEISTEYGINVAWKGEIVSLNEDFIILKGIVIVNDDFIESNNISIDRVIFSGHFEIAYTLTCHKWQGQTIKEPYAIYDTNNKDLYYLRKNFLYTAFSRTGTLKNIHIDKKNTSKKWNKWRPSNRTVDAKIKTKEYKIYNFENYYKNKLNIEDTKKYKLYKTVNITYIQLKNLLNVLNHNSINQIIIEKPILIQSFKPLLNQTNRKTIINVYKNRIKCTYYDEKEDKKKIKDMKPTKTRDLQETFNKVIKLYPDAEVNDKLNLLNSQSIIKDEYDKNKLLLSFC